MGLLQQQDAAAHKARQRRLYHSTIRPLLALSPSERREIKPPALPPEVAAYKERMARLKIVRDEISLLNAKLREANELDAIQPPTQSVRAIAQTVARFYGIRMTGLMSRCRLQSIVRPRQVAQYLCCQLTRRSLPEIGKFFGRDHSTIHSARARIEELRKTDVRLEFEIKQMMEMLALPDGEDAEDLPSFLPVRA